MSPGNNFGWEFFFIKIKNKQKKKKREKVVKIIKVTTNNRPVVLLNSTLDEAESNSLQK